MKLNSFMPVAALVAFLFGLAFLLVPVQTMSMYGVTLDISGQYIARYFGSALFGFAVITWYARNADSDSKGLRAILLGGFVLSVTGFIASIFDVLYGPGNNLMWSTVAIYFLLSIGFGYYYFKKS
jgi:phosphoglycerol transferase MdoB-like AlkP superfamily enzyme